MERFVSAPMGPVGVCVRMEGANTTGSTLFSYIPISSAFEFIWEVKGRRTVGTVSGSVKLKGNTCPFTGSVTTG